MNELLDDTKSVLLFLMGAVMTLFGWIGKRALNRLDECVTRDELTKTLSQMREDRLQMHRENREELRYIRERVDGIADRQ
jgi:hypothetical protein